METGGVFVLEAKSININLSREQGSTIRPPLTLQKEKCIHLIYKPVQETLLEKQNLAYRRQKS